MTSKQVMLTALWLSLAGCSLWSPRPAEPLRSPYPTRRVWAVAPLRNESGSLQADGLAIADKLIAQLENASNLDLLPLNRTLEAMQALQMGEVAGPADARRLLDALGVDGLLVGTISAYDPYDPPKLGLAVELYASPLVEAPIASSLDVTQLSVAATADGAGLLPGVPGGLPGTPPRSLAIPRMPATAGAPAPAHAAWRPVNVISAIFDASDPHTRRMMQAYAVQRGPEAEPDAWRRYRLSMDLFTEFAGYVVSWRLLQVESQRLLPPTTQPVP